MENRRILNAEEEDSSPLLEDPAIVIEDDEESENRYTQPQGTILSSVINITNTILGSGMLAMPSAIAATGLVMGMFFIGMCAMASAFGLYLLSRMASHVGRKSSFFTCASITFPSAAVYFDLAIAVKCFGVSISYLVITGGLLPQVVKGFFPSVSSSSIWLERSTWITIGMFVVGPLCFLRRLDSLRYTSAFSLSAVVYLLFVVMLYYINPSPTMPAKPNWSELEFFKFDNNLISHFPIFVFAYTCHQNIFSVHNELVDNSLGMMQTVIQRSVGTAFFVYQLIGVIGYLTFGKYVSSNVIALYPSGIIVTGAQLAIVFLVLFSYPLQVHPLRNSLDKVIPGSDHNEIPWPRFTAMTLLIMVCSYFFAVTISDLSTVLGLVGATGSTTIGYILPGIFYFKFCQNQRVPGEKMGTLQFLSLVLVFAGAFIMVTSLGNIILGGGGGH